MTVFLLVAHGSHLPETEQEISQLVNILRKKNPGKIIEWSFLEIGIPNLPEGIDNVMRHSPERIVILLNFLNSGKYIDKDIPRIIKEAKQKYPNVAFRTTKPLGQHHRIAELFLDEIK